MKKYDEFKKNLEGLRRNGKISLYESWNKSKDAVDSFYIEHQLDSDSLYKRLVALRRKIEIFKFITFPVWITIIFGVLVTLSLNIIGYMKTDMLDAFLISSKKIFEGAQLKLTGDYLEQANKLYNDITSEVVSKLVVFMIIMTGLLIIIAFVMQNLFSQIYLKKQRKFEIMEYETNKIEQMLL